MSKALFLALTQALGQNVVATAVKTGFGHDKAGRQGTVMLGKTKAFSLDDDGWAGGYEVHIIIHDQDATNTLLARAKTPELLALMAEIPGCGKIETPFTDHMVLVEIAGALIQQVENEKFAKKLKKELVRSIVVGTEEAYGSYSWKGIKDLSDLVKMGGGLAGLQATYEKAKAALKPGQRILNPESQLLALGVKL